MTASPFLILRRHFNPQPLLLSHLKITEKAGKSTGHEKSRTEWKWILSKSHHSIVFTSAFSYTSTVLRTFEDYVSVSMFSQ